MKTFLNDCKGFKISILCKLGHNFRAISFHLNEIIFVNVSNTTHKNSGLKKTEDWKIFHYIDPKRLSFEFALKLVSSEYLKCFSSSAELSLLLAQRVFLHMVHMQTEMGGYLQMKTVTSRSPLHIRCIQDFWKIIFKLLISKFLLVIPIVQKLNRLHTASKCGSIEY